MRVLHVPAAVGGNPQSLARAERSLGVDSLAVTLRPPPFGYPADEVLWADGDGLARRELKRWRLFRRALADYDVIHFNFGQSILTWGGLFSNRTRLRPLERLLLPFARYLELLDLPALRRAGKVIAVTYQGDDARQGDVCGRLFELSMNDGVGAGYYTPWSDARKRERIASFARYADLIYGVNPDLLHMLPPPARFIPFANVDIEDWKPVPPAPQSRPPFVVHAPSHRGAKGTMHVLEAVARLRAEGAAFEFRLVEGVSNAEARRIYEQADLVVDQLLAGWYGGLAVEAMALAKPVVAYIRDSDLGFLPEAMRADIPIVNAQPQSIHAALKSCLASGRAALAEVGLRSRRYVETWHDPRAVARELIADYESVLRRRAR